MGGTVGTPNQPSNINPVVPTSSGVSQPPPAPSVSSHNTPGGADITANRIVNYDANNYIIRQGDPNVNVNRPIKDVPEGKLDLLINSLVNVCSKYISEQGCNIQFCCRFHVCLNWLNGDGCKDNCVHEHSFGNENISLYSPIIRALEISDNELKEILKRNLSFQHDFMNDPRSYICMNFVSKMCKLTACESLHLHSPYSWQVYLQNSWFSFSDKQNKELETSFCDPAVSYLILDVSSLNDLSFPNQTIKIDFQKMVLTAADELTAFRIRRLSTPSDVTVSSPFATRWLWYRLDFKGDWIYLASAYIRDFLMLQFSDFLEMHFINNTKEILFRFNRNGPDNTINFLEMTQKNDFGNIKREIRRRPMPSCSNGSEITIKSFWTNLTSRERYIRQSVLETSPEFHFVNNLIVSTLFVDKISIERIENHYLWESYQVKKEKMMRTYNNNKEMVNEQYMFHGTTKNVIDGICSENLDWRLNGTRVGHSYGKGAYFANTAITASSYAPTDSEGYKWIFVTIVLVGKATLGKPSMTMPPIDPITNIRFDTTVNDNLNPQYFVKYNLDEYYPAYLVKLKKSDLNQA